MLDTRHATLEQKLQKIVWHSAAFQGGNVVLQQIKSYERIQVKVWNLFFMKWENKWLSRKYYVPETTKIKEEYVDYLVHDHVRENSKNGEHHIIYRGDHSSIE